MKCTHSAPPSRATGCLRRSVARLLIRNNIPLHFSENFVNINNRRHRGCPEPPTSRLGLK
jgi:hypothetical protein